MKSFMLKTGIIFALLIALNAQAICQLYDWRGPDRSGVYNESGLLKKWPAGGPELLWDNEDIGFGYSSATVTDDAIYITGRIEEDDILTAFGLDGKKLWAVSYGKAWIRNHTGTRSTPTYANGKIYQVSGAGDIVCVSDAGKIVWSKNHYALYESSPIMFGISESPLYIDGKIIASPGGSIASLVAFDAENGNVLWEAEPLNEGPQYVNPLLIKRGGKNIIVTNTNKHIIGVDAADGTILWRVNYDDQVKLTGRIRKNHATTPVYRDGKILIANGYNFIALQLELSEDGKSVEINWTSDDIDPHHGGIVLIGDHAYSSNYLSNSMGNWICVDWFTGETKWVERWNNKGSIISADNMLYLYEEKTGNLALANVDPEKLDIVSEFKIPKGDGPYWSHPVISKGKLYVRHGEVLMVYSLK